MKRIPLWIPALLLTLTLAGCAADPPPQAQTTVPVPESPTPAAANYAFQVLPVTEEGINTLYGWEGYQVRNITPYEGDFLVEYGYESDPNFSLLAWVFSQTGRQVQLTAMEHFQSYEITGPAQVRYRTDGVSAITPNKGLPEDMTVWVLGDEDGRIDPDQSWSAVQSFQETTWLDPAEPFYAGAWDTSGGPVYPEQRQDRARHEQVYDARIDADGLSFSFIPNGDSKELFEGFFPAVTSVPSIQTEFDPGSRVFTLRLFDTCLESGAASASLNENLEGMRYPPDLYPYSFPAGSLGRDSHFLQDVTIAEDGEDVVVTAVLTEHAYRFTVESSNLGFDNIPSFRIVFREKNPDIDGWD